MREDMARVVIERPRYGSTDRYHDVRSRAVAHHDLDRLADLPHGEGMRRPHVRRKYLSDLLGPLRKFLVRQVGRPWNKVHSEICERISPNSTTQLHILSHLDDLIDTRTSLGPDGRVRRHTEHSWLSAYVADIPGLLYVHPVTGIIRRTPEGRSPLKRRPTGPDPKFKAIGPERELWQRDGIWYWAVFATAQPRVTRGADGKTRTDWPSDCFSGDRVRLGTRYRIGKRQASGSDLRRYRLSNEPPAE